MFLLFCIIFIILIKLNIYSTVVFIIVERLFNCQYFFEKIFTFFPPYDIIFSYKKGPLMKYEILTVKQFQIVYPGIYKRCFSYNSIRHPFCKAEVTGDALAGTFAVPKKPEVTLKKQIFGYCIIESRLLFIDDTDYVSTLLAALETAEPHAGDSPILLLYDLMEYMIKDDMLFLQGYEDELEDLEDIITGEKEDSDVDFEKTILAIRKNLSALGMYYDRLSDASDTIQQWAAEQHMKAKPLPEIYDNKIKRLGALVASLKEYSIQLRELRQSRIDIRQNQIMQLLTIITTIFMPLTLITGWYGMNFRNMPELSHPYAYGCVAVFSAVVVLIEILLFKRKKWFK